MFIDDHTTQSPQCSLKQRCYSIMLLDSMDAACNHPESGGYLFFRRRNCVDQVQYTGPGKVLAFTLHVPYMFLVHPRCQHPPQIDDAEGLRAVLMGPLAEEPVKLF